MKMSEYEILTRLSKGSKFENRTDSIRGIEKIIVLLDRMGYKREKAMGKDYNYTFEYVRNDGNGYDSWATFGTEDNELFLSFGTRESQKKEKKDDGWKVGDVDNSNPNYPRVLTDRGWWTGD